MTLRPVLLLFFFFLIFSGSSAQKLKIMTYNIHHGRNAQNQVDLQAIAEIIKNSGAELVGLQEVDSVCRRSGNVDQMKELGKLTGMYYNFQRHLEFDGGAYGLGILSKFPVEQALKYQLIYSINDMVSDNRVLMVSDITLNDSHTVRFANVHFDHREDPAIRSRQSKETLDYLKKLSPPVILTGDLNAEPDKPEIRKILVNFSDTDPSGAFTFPADEPRKKIDYILVNKSHLNKVTEHEVINEPVASDHRPVVAIIVLKQ